MIWPSSSCAFDLHLQSTIMISIVTDMTPWSPSSWSLSTCHHMVVSPTIAFATILSHSDKVKQLYGACILCNKETTIRLLPVADNFNKTWSSHTTNYITSCLDHITAQHALQKQVRRPLFCLLQFLRGCYGLSKNRSYLHIQKTTTIFLSSMCCFNLHKDRA